MSGDLIDTTEMYLKTVLELEEAGIVPLRARIAERLHQTGPTVSQTVARMERDGLLVVQGDRHLTFTEVGRERAVSVMRKHRLAERLLVDVIGLDWVLAHDEACRWEHVMSTDVEKRMIGLLDDPKQSPYGNPIPGLEALGASSKELGAAVPLPQLVTGADPVEVRLDWIGEGLQAEPDLLETVWQAKLMPGATITAKRGGLGVVLRTAEGPEAELSEDAANQLFVVAV
ncbi:metal-dependent transcriptional regulator [Parenemella sanctibonifatiensis]|uniref:Dihydrofolate reductase n=1 Tax=Parenemella sanctibonifatiensis TaxID=2016505 RepID=A0A255ELN8_9ACTN|nr:metal-dependent transcriptional regulator [Parenemella sanctibonifatiensis]OYN88442.1 dihydrofolate reductase [Parenemella sanctibonifatiensis]OYN92447.1 dihydrofolate reductase [Parenemella sanctibonifatiensis]